MLIYSHQLANAESEFHHKINGRIKDFYFNDYNWTILSLISESGQRVVNDSPQSISPPTSQARNTQEIIGHRMQVADGEMGHIVEFILDEETWVIRYLIIETRSWWPEKEAIISPEWIDKINWIGKTAFVNISQSKIKSAPIYAPNMKIERDFESEIFGHYNREEYWSRLNSNEEVEFNTCRESIS